MCTTVLLNSCETYSHMMHTICVQVVNSCAAFDKGIHMHLTSGYFLTSIYSPIHSSFILQEYSVAWLADRYKLIICWLVSMRIKLLCGSHALKWKEDEYVFVVEMMEPKLCRDSPEFMMPVLQETGGDKGSHFQFHKQQYSHSLHWLWHFIVYVTCVSGIYDKHLHSIKSTEVCDRYLNSV